MRTWQIICACIKKNVALDEREFDSISGQHQNSTGTVEASALCLGVQWPHALCNSRAAKIQEK